MGGGDEIGNVTPAAEFNISDDPETAAMVFAAGFRHRGSEPANCDVAFDADAAGFVRLLLSMFATA